MRLLICFGAATLLALSGCNDGKVQLDDTASDGTDGGTTDGGTTDGGTTDGGTTDGGTTDGGTTDGGTTDGGTTDGGTTDGGTTDGGTVSEEVAFSNLSWSLHDIEAMVIASWEQNVPATVVVEYSFEDDQWYSTPPIDAVAGVNEQLIVGIPYETDAQWRVSVAPDSGYSGESVEGEPITTGSLPPGLPLGTVEVADEANWLPEGNYLLTSVNEQTGGWGAGNDYWVFIMDRQARPVWVLKTPNRNWTLFAQVSVTGDHILFDEASLWSKWDDGESSKIHRRYLDEEIEVIDAPGHHHAFVELPDGTLAWGSQAHGGGEALAIKGPADTEEHIIWTCDDDWPGVGYCESNGLFYSVERDSFLYSFYTNSSLVEVDYATGTSSWWAGTVRDGYSFDPRDSQFDWQHGVSYTDDGTLLLSSERSTGPGWNDRTTVVYEYEVDHKAQTLTEIWRYDAEAYASTNGDAWRLDNGNTLHLVGSAGQIKEVQPDGTVVWHVDMGGEHLLGRGQFIEDLYDLIAP